MQLVAALGLHRKWYVKMGRNGSTYLERELRKRIFWSAYTLDKYLSIMFGRPRLLHDEDVDQEFPDLANDDDMSQEDPGKRTGSPDSMMMASILHYRYVVYLLLPIGLLSPVGLAAYWKKSLESFILSTRRPGILLPKSLPISLPSLRNGRRVRRLCSTVFERQASSHLCVGRVRCCSLRTLMP